MSILLAVYKCPHRKPHLTEHHSNYLQFYDLLLFVMQYEYMLAGQSLTVGLMFQCCWSIPGVIAVLWGSAATAPFCQAGDFDAEVRQLLEANMLTAAEIANLSTVFSDLEATLQIVWPGSKVFALGSFITGLASKSSDADCMVQVPRHYVSSDRQLILEAAHLLKQYPHLYDDVRAKVQVNRRMPLLKFKYVPTKRNCDVNFISNLALKNTRMMGYYLNLNKNFLTLAAILKLWTKVQKLKDMGAIASNSLNLLIIFYLQQEKIAPPFTLLQRHLIRCPVNHWETDFEKIPYNTTITASVYKLLGGFFKYYSQFNFEEYVVSPLLGRPIRKTDFEDTDNLPEELSLYKNYVKQPNSRPLLLSTKMCVQDAVEQRRNTADVSDDKANKLIEHVKFAARMYDVLPKHVFLRVVLSKDVKRRIERLRVDEMKRLVGCVNTTTFTNELYYELK